MGNNLKEDDRSFLEDAKSEGYRVEVVNEIKCSGYHEFAFETPGGHLFSYNEIMFDECQGCIDDENELGIETGNCICTKEQFRAKVKRILDLLEDYEEDTMRIFANNAD